MHTADELIELFRRHTDEDLVDMLHTLVLTNKNDAHLLNTIHSALRTTNIIRADGTESPTI